jgi:hypothetical protein
LLLVPEIVNVSLPLLSSANSTTRLWPPEFVQVTFFGLLAMQPAPGVIESAPGSLISATLFVTFTSSLFASPGAAR